MGQFTREMQDALGSFNGMAVFFLAVEGHWVLVVAQPTASCWRWWLFDGLHFNCREFVDDLIRSFMASWGGGQVPHQLHLVQRYAQMDQTSCGTIALAHLAFCLQVTNELTPEDILHWHFTLLAGDFGGQPRATGPHGRDLPAMLADILITKGVHPESALHRARDAIDTLGGKNVQSALAAKNPWQALKAEATKPGKNFKFITPGELDAHIEAQAKSRYGVDPRSKKQKQRTSSTVAKTPLKIDPRQIKLIQGHFRDPEGHPLDQLAIDQVGADSAGVAICSSLEAAPYIAEGKHISTSPLGLLVLDDLHQAELGYAEAQTIRFAGQYIATGEPVLLNARLIQLGDSAVVRAIGKDPMAGVGVAPTAVIKVSVYKDEFGSSWSASFVKHQFGESSSWSRLSICARRWAVGLRAGHFTPLSMRTPLRWSMKFGDAAFLFSLARPVKRLSRRTSTHSSGSPSRPCPSSSVSMSWASTWNPVLTPAKEPAKTLQ